MNHISIKQQYLEYLQFKIFVKAWIVAQTSRAPILLFHESLGSVAQWKDFPEQIANATQRTVIAYDRIGFGQSTGLSQLLKPNFLKDEAQHIIPLILEHFDVNEFVAFGHSIGGGFAAGCALEYRQCVALVMEASLGYMDEQTIHGVSEAKIAFQDPQRFNRLRVYHGHKAQAVLDSWTESWLSEAFKNWSILEALSEISCPIMIFQGMQDPYANIKQAHAIKNVVHTECVLHLIDHCGHIPHQQQNDLVVARLKTFLDDIV